MRLSERSSDTDASPAASPLQSFVAWLAEVQSSLRVAISIRSITSKSLGFSFDIANPVLVGTVTDNGDLTVAVEWEGECWDFLLSNEARPERRVDGFICSLCEAGGKQRLFANPEELWKDHLFKPLEDWINSELARAKTVALYRSGGTTWARLILGNGDVGSPASLVQLI